MTNFFVTYWKSELKWGRAYAIAVLIYALSHGLMLALYGAWWDDMVFWNVSPEFLEEFAGPNNVNSPFLLHTIQSISLISSLSLRNFVYRFIPFLCYFISLSCFFLFVKKATNNLNYTFYSSIIVACCGLNKCMPLLCCFTYSVSISLFMLGLVFFTYDYFNGKIGYKIVTALLWTSSLVIWRSAVLVIPMILIVATGLKTNFNWRNKDCYKAFLIHLFKNHGIIIAGLFIFSILYKTILAPHGGYGEYYAVDIRCLVLSPLTTFTSCCSLLLGYFGTLLAIFTSVGAMGYKILVFIFISTFILILLHKEQPICPVSKRILWFAILLLFFSIMPHLLKEFAFAFNLTGYKSRVTTLAIYPIAMILTYVICKFSKRIQLATITCIVSLSIISSLYTYMDYSKGWAKSEAIALFLKNNDLNGKNIVVIDNAQSYSPEYESYRNYEIEGCSRLAYGVYSATKCEMFNQKCDKCNLWSTFTPDYYLYIDINNTAESPAIIGGKSLLYWHLDKSKYDKTISDLLMFRLIPKDDFNAMHADVDTNEWFQKEK